MRSNSFTYMRLMILILILIQYQNCGESPNVSFLNSDKASLTTGMAQGGADSFDGKPSLGDYIRTFPDFRCIDGNTVSAQALLNINNTQGTILRDNCASMNFPIAFSDPEIHFSFFNPDFLAYAGAIFEKVEEASAPKHITESLCQFQNSSFGMDVVVKNNLESTARVAKIYIGKKDGNTQYRTDDFAVSKNNVNQTTQIISSSYDFLLELADQSVNGKTFVGKLLTTVDGQNYSLTTECRRMSVDPVLELDTNGLVAYFKFDESSLTPGAQLADSSGQARTFTFNALATQVNLTTGKLGNGLPLQAAMGQDGYFAQPSSSFPSSNIFTISYWHKIPSILSYASVVVAGTNTIASRLNFSSGVDLGNYYGKYFDPSIGPNGLAGPLQTLSPVLDVWHHYVLVVDSTNVTSYLDGNLYTSDARSSSNTDILGSIHEIWFGESGVQTPSSNSNDNGFLDELSIWSRALSASEVKILYNKIVVR